MEESPLQKILRDSQGEQIIPQPYSWVYVDLKGNWLGLRVEPEDKSRSEAFKDAVNKGERWYNRQERKWMFRARNGALLFELLKTFCPDHALILEEESGEVIRSLLFGPGIVEGKKVEIPGLPQGMILGKMSELDKGV